MTQKSLAYMVLAVAVGYLLVSALPQQLAMYTIPQSTLERSDGNLGVDSIPPEGDIESLDDEKPGIKSFEGTGEHVEPSFWERTRLPSLIKWWTVDILIAFVIYWGAKQKLS